MLNNTNIFTQNNNNTQNLFQQPQQNQQGVQGVQEEELTKSTIEDET